MMSIGETCAFSSIGHFYGYNAGDDLHELG